MNFRHALLFLLLFSFYSCKKSDTKNIEEQPPASVGLTVADGADCKFPNVSGRNDVTLGFPRNDARQKTSGTVKVAVIFVDFPDAVSSRSPEQVLGTTATDAQNFISAASHSKLNLVFEPKFKWFRMNKRSTEYGWADLTFLLHKAYIQEAVSLADPEYDFSQTDQILIIANPDARALNRTSAFIGFFNNGISAENRTLTNAMTAMSDVLVPSSGLWFPHELGHSFGAPDLYNFGGPLHGFVGEFSVMSNGRGRGPMYNAWEKWLFGWFSNAQVTCVRGKGTGTVQLTPVENENGMKLLVLPINANSAVIVEDRRKIGYDAQLPKEGPLVYLIDTKIESGLGSLMVLPSNLSDQAKTSAPLGVGESVSYGSIVVKCTASDATGSTVEYTLK